MNYNEFTNPDNWIGGFYELSMEFHPVGNNVRLNQALTALGKLNFFSGFWKERHHYLSNSITFPIHIDDDSVNQFYGTITLSDGKTLPCVVTIVRIIGELEWLDIGIPEAILEKLYDLQYPLTKEFNPWLAGIDEIFIRMAESLFDRSPFELALIGEEISGYANQENITLKDLEKITCILPHRIQKRLGVLEKGEGLTNQLRLFDHR